MHIISASSLVGECIANKDAMNQTRVLKVYVAGKLADAEQIGELASALERRGHAISHKWWEADFADSSLEARGKRAFDDVVGVRNADVLVADMRDPDYPYRGTNHEIGVALALSKPVIVWLPPNPTQQPDAFLFLDAVYRVFNVDPAINPSVACALDVDTFARVFFELVHEFDKYVVQPKHWELPRIADTSVDTNTERPRGIVFGSSSRVGKDTLCDMLKQMAQFRYSPVLRFSLPLYDAMYACQKALGVEQEKRRTFMQTFGDWAKQEYGQNVFVDALGRRIDAVEAGVPVIVNDVRYPFEADMLRRKGFKFVKVARRGSEAHVTNAGHSSETALNHWTVKPGEEWDARIDNDGTMDELRANLFRVLKETGFLA